LLTQLMTASCTPITWRWLRSTLSHRKYSAMKKVATKKPAQRNLSVYMSPELHTAVRREMVTVGMTWEGVVQQALGMWLAEQEANCPTCGGLWNKEKR
jgi:hypothetical protein